MTIEIGHELSQAIQTIAVCGFLAFGAWLLMKKW